MGSTENHSSDHQGQDHQGQSEVMPNQTLHTSDSLIHQYLDSYRVIERLGGGAMASVYRAVDVTSNQQVALKILAPGADDILRERFRVEARTVSVLEHPNIVRTLRVGQVPNGFPYIAMELVAGDSLATLLERQNQLSVADSCLLLEPVARALAYAHSHHVVHRDVKPSNILLRHTPPGAPHTIQLAASPTPVIPLLSDFGIARALDAPELTTAGRTIGTPAYMSPEQCAGTRNLDGRADIYSLATVLYRCLVGRPPFMGATTQILHAHVYEALTIPDAVAQALPPIILSILQRALQKNPEDRYADMALFADELATIVRHVSAPGSRPEEGTVTLPLLVALQPEQEKKTAHVLIPSVSEYGARPQPMLGRPESASMASDGATRNPWNTTRSTQSTPPVKANPTRATSPAARRRAPTNRLYLAIGTLLSIALIALALTAFASILPNFSIWNMPGPEQQAPVLTQPAESPDAVQTSVSLTSTLVAGATPMQSLPIPAELSANGGIAVASALTGSIGIINPVASPSGTLPITDSLVITVAYDAYDTGNIWKEDVLFFYRYRDWRETRRSALEVFSAAFQQEANITLSQVIQMKPDDQAELIVKSLLNNTDAPFWTQLRETVTPTEVEQVFFDAYVGIANQENQENQPEEALPYFDAAFVLRADELINKLSGATARYVNADGPPKTLAAEALSDLYRSYAGQFAAGQSFCSAAEYLTVAEALAATETVSDTLQTYREQCNNAPPALLVGATPSPLPVAQNGALLYSTLENGLYRIYRVPLTGENSTHTLVVENATQPGVSADEHYMAFFSRRSDSEGLSLYDFTRPSTPQSIFPRLSDFIEDGRGSAPSWAPGSNGLVFSSDREGDRRLRIYINTAPDRNNGRSLGLGEDPAWGLTSDSQSLIVFKGTDDTGNNPGLWLATEAGARVKQLTTNGNDRRPVWTPDGRYVVFMRQVEGGNWEVFRVSIADGSEIRLTNNPAQDGLPTISPDGQSVAFASDRSGAGWVIWQVGIDGSSEQPLVPIQGVLENWLEHAIQWVN